MKVLLTSNASYDPPKGGSTRTNLLWLAELVKSGHHGRVVCAAEHDASTRSQDGIEIQSVQNLSRRTALLGEQIRAFQPDWTLVSSEDVSHVLLREANHVSPGRIVYLAHTPQFYPFGPASWNSDPQAALLLKQAAGIVAIGEHMQEYIREHLGRDAVVIRPPMDGSQTYPRFGSFDSGYVLMINPCVVKGLAIFLALAERCPDYVFAGLSGWGTTAADRESMRCYPNVRILETVSSIDEVLAQARVLLMPSLWYEGFGLIAMESMLRGLPVIASDSGGLKEAKQGTKYVVPVKPIERFEPIFDETLMPRAIESEQAIDPWEKALRGLLSDPVEYWAEAERSRQTGLAYVSKIRAGAMEEYLRTLQPGKLTQAAVPASQVDRLSASQRALLLQRLRRKD